MKNRIKSFFIGLRQNLFEWRLDSEIYGRIFPHLENERDHGYPFHSDEEFQKFCEDGEVKALPFVREIERDITRMPKGYGEAFRYILYRDIKTRGGMPRSRGMLYQLLARRRVYRTTCDPRFVATRA
jgi:hypothetical protein